jgi:succinate-semialdehyde dehydrogenase/glutarate-semialdehyde dehydrogenase
MSAVSDDGRLLFIDGEWRAAADGAAETVVDPATGGSAGTTALAGAADLEAAVAAARERGRAWREAAPADRSGVLRRAGDLIEERLDQIAVRLTREQGKPLADAAKEIRFAVEVFRYYAEEARRIWGSVRPSSRPDVKSIVTYAPVGIVGAIVPWNYPVDLYAWKVAPALAVGCPVIAKPPADAPLAIASVVQALRDAGLPAGALADLPGGPELGQALVAHAEIAALTVTASTPTGRKIAAAAAPTLKRLSLELGGQTPLIVLEDADVAEAAAAAVRRSFSNMGQICIAVNRVLVAEPRRGEFVEAAAERTRTLRIGNGLEDGVEYGPVFNEAVVEKTLRHIDDARRRGARIVTGGDRLDRDGLFLAPAVLDAVPGEAAVMNEETFGPVMPVAGADGDAELLALANALPYGLAAYIYSQDLERAWALADRIEAGSVGINVNDVTELQAPFGGWKLSGSGRDLGPEALHNFLNTKHIRARVRDLLPADC